MKVVVKDDSIKQKTLLEVNYCDWSDYGWWPTSDSCSNQGVWPTRKYETAEKVSETFVSDRSKEQECQRVNTCYHKETIT